MPALSALQELVLTREEAMERIEMLASSSERDDREYAATALSDIAYIKPAAIRPQTVERLMQVAETAVRGIAREIAPLIRNENERLDGKRSIVSALSSPSGAMAVRRVEAPASDSRTST